MADDIIKVGLTADPSGLVAGFNTATNTVVGGTRQMESALGGAADSIGNFMSGLAVSLAAGLSVDRLVSFGEKSLELGDRLNKMAQQTGIATDELSALNAQASLADVSLDGFGTAMARLARSSTEAAAGSKQQAQAFQAIGVSVKDAAGNIRPMADILQDVSTKLAGYKDGAGKTAEAQEIFGRGAAQLIPLLNNLGTNGFAKVKEEAEAYNQVIGPDQARQSEEFNDNLKKLQMSTTGFANAVMRDLLPAMTQYSQIVADASKSSDGYSSSAAKVADVIRTITAAMNAFLQIGVSFDAAMAGIAKTTMATVGTIAQGSVDTIKAGIQNGFTGAVDTAKQYGGALVDYLKGVWTGVGNSTAGAADNIKRSTSALLGVFANVSSGVSTTANHLKDFVPPAADAGNAAEKAAKQAREMDAAFDALQGTLDALTAQIEGPYIAAEAKYLDTLTKIENQAEAFVIAGGDVNEALKLWQQGEELAADALEKTTEQIEQQHNLMAQQVIDIDQLTQVLKLEPQYRDAATATLKKYDDLMKSHYDFYGNYIADENDLKAALDAQAPGYEANLQHIKDITDAQKASDQATKDWVNIWQQAGDQLADTFSKILVEGGSLFDSLVSLAKQTVEQIIAYFAKLAIINPILNSIFGGSAGFSLLPTLESAGMSAIGGGASITGGTSGASGNSYGGLFDMGKGIWNGFQNGFSTFLSGNPAVAYGSNMFGTYTNPGAFGGATYGVGGSYAPSALGYAGGIAGGLYAGYGEYQRSGSLIGGAAYGIGTAGLIGGLGGLATGAGFGAGLAGGLGAGAAGAAGYSGLAAAIPVVGWIALAAMLIDKFSGGKLFGTKGTVQEGSSTLSIGAGGADFANQVSLKGQKALFGGAKWSTQDIAETPEQKAAAQAFFDSMTKTMKQYADQFGVKAGDLVGASFQQVFDKKGNLTGETHATIAGYNYDNLTQDQFSQAYVSANELSVLDQFDSKLEATIATYRQTADGLNQIAAGLTQAEGYIKSGGDFLAIAGQDTLSGVVKLAEGMQQAGETIDQTINRLIQAQQQYDAFVGQFKPAATYASDFQASIAGIAQQMQQNIDTANALAKAAGAEGASEQDLVNIHNYAAQQFAQAVAALKQSTANLAANLGYAMPTDLNDINSQISALEAAQSAYKSSIGGAANALQSAAQRAVESMNLLLGDLSPYNDKQKLQMALQGQMAGTVTPQQVLEIARRLDATGADYKQIFDQVMAIGDRTQRGSQAGGGGSSQTFTAGDAQKLDDLKKQRDQIEAAQRHHDALQLAQNIADEVGATGETIDQALADAGITDITPFLKDLGIADKAGFDSFIESLEKNTDSAGDNTRDIASKIDVTNTLLTQIRDGDSGGSPSGPATAPPAHSGHASRGTGGGNNNPAAPPQMPGGRSSRGQTEIAGTRTR